MQSCIIVAPHLAVISDNQQGLLKEANGDYVAAFARYEATMRESSRYADGALHDEHLHARLNSHHPG